MHSSVCLLTVLVAALAAGCAGAPATPAPSAAPSTPAAASPAASPLANPPVGPSTPATPPSQPSTSPVAACPTGSPLTVDAYLAADPSCFVSADITVAGWSDDAVNGWFGPRSIEPSWLGNDATEYSVLRSTLPGAPCPSGDGGDGPGVCPGALVVHVSPESAFTLEGNGRWVLVTGHRADPASATCRYVAGDEGGSDPTPAPDDVVATCASRFVLTSAVEATPPADAVAALHCPGGNVVEMHDYVAAVPGCFRGKTVSIRAWEDRPMSTGWESPVPAPEWLAVPDGSRFFWSADPVNPDGCVEAACPGIFVHQDPSATLALGKAGRWVVIAGHREDPVAETCRYQAGAGAIDPVESALIARRLCRSAFVIESIRVAEAP